MECSDVVSLIISNVEKISLAVLIATVFFRKGTTGERTYPCRRPGRSVDRIHLVPSGRKSVSQEGGGCRVYSAWIQRVTHIKVALHPT